MEQPTKDNVLDMHREVSIQVLKSLSCYAVRTPRGQKDPGVVGWDPKANSAEKSRETLDVIQRTNDNLGVHLFGRTVDVDIDTDNPYLQEALDFFLPPTPHVWGRPSRRRTHRLYELTGRGDEFDPSSYPFLSKIQAHPDINVEIRGGEQKSGRYSLLPGSLHPSGESYEWEDLKAARSSPVFVDAWRLVDGVRLACVTALIAPYWQEGVRNELCKALCGFLHRAACYAEELALDAPFDKEAAGRLLDGIMEVSGDDPADRPMRLKTLEQTWEKADKGVPVLGASHIERVTGDNRILPLLYALLAHTPDLQQLDEIFEKYAVLRNTTCVLDLDVGAGGNYVMAKEAFVFTLMGRYVTSPKGRVPVASVFMNSLQRTIIDKVAAHPGKPRTYEERDGTKVANIWKGWAIEPFEGEVADSEVQVFTDYLKGVVCRGDIALYDWIRMWIADIFQNPSSKPGTALVLVGLQGAGKSILSEKILRPIIGDAHSMKAGSLERMTSKFNNMMSGKLLIQGEEVMNTRRQADADSLKDAITSNKRTIEMKGRDSFEMDDFARYIFTSNHVRNAIAVEAIDRRYTIVEVSSMFAYTPDVSRQHIRNDFWSKMLRWLEVAEDKVTRPNHDNLSKLHKWFLQQEIDKKCISAAYNTDIKRQTAHNSVGGYDAWLLSLIEFNNPFDNLTDFEKGFGHSYRLAPTGLVLTSDWPDFVKYSIVETCYNSHNRGLKYKLEPQSAQQIAAFFKNEGLLPNTEARTARSGGVKSKVRPFPRLIEIENYLVAKGYNVLRSQLEDSEAPQPDVDEDDRF